MAIKTTAIVAKNQWKYISELEMDLAPVLPKFLGNAGEINQIVLNLIVNSAHAIEAVKRPELGMIKIETRSSDGFIILSVSDNGCGIPEADVKKIYDPFFTSKEVGKGTGQGLAITYNIVTNKLGGAITVESETGIGTKFEISIPCNPEEMETTDDS
jgi:signal transduction histidine kinase